tara:strand:+ start:1643 stop:1885 length:243 start_codon:yes stop_codon:yes gene_type:complete
MNKDTKIMKEKLNTCFKEMKDQFNLETARLQQETQKLKEKEEQEFLKFVYESGIPVCCNNKLTVLDKTTNKIVELSSNKL